MKLEVISPHDKKVMQTIPIEVSIFPDGQRHVTLVPKGLMTKNMHYCLTTSIKSADDLFDIALVRGTIPWGAYCALQVEYLMGARMDEAIDKFQPCTAEVVGDMLISMQFDVIAVLDCHSEDALKYLGGTAVNILPKLEVRKYLERFDSHDTVIIIPDDGATERVECMVDGQGFDLVQCYKTRSRSDGKLSGFGIEAPTDRVDGKVCVIIDDICDGGGTFTGLASVLRDAGAKAVHLWVTHGIFSKGRALEGLNTVTAMNDWLEEEQDVASTATT